LRGGFKKLDPRRIPPDKIEEAASLSCGGRWSEEVASELGKKWPWVLLELGLQLLAPIAVLDRIPGSKIESVSLAPSKSRLCL
jgi:hypothetical protein